MTDKDDNLSIEINTLIERIDDSITDQAAFTRGTHRDLLKAQAPGPWPDPEKKTFSGSAKEKKQT